MKFQKIKINAKTCVKRIIGNQLHSANKGVSKDEKCKKKKRND